MQNEDPFLVAEWKKVREDLRKNYADREAHKRRVDILRIKNGYPQHFNSYPNR